MLRAGFGVLFVSPVPSLFARPKMGGLGKVFFGGLGNDDLGGKEEEKRGEEGAADDRGGTKGRINDDFVSDWRFPCSSTYLVVSFFSSS